MKNIQLTFGGNVLSGTMILSEKKVLPYLRKIRKASITLDKKISVSMRTIIKDYTYHNRYNDAIRFTQFEDTPNVIEMTGFNPEWIRVGWRNDESKIITMVDPSGGPYITDGSDMKLFGFTGIVDHFTIKNSIVFIHLKK